VVKEGATLAAWTTTLSVAVPPSPSVTVKVTV
jgi:hypothetical protein